MALRRAFRALLPTALLALLLPLSGCGGAPQADGPSVSGSQGSTPTPDPRPTPASSKGPARNLPRPVLPEAAKQNTKEGFAAFTQYWFDTVTYGLETGDSSALREISLPDCQMCNGYIEQSDKVKQGIGWHVGPRWTVSTFTSDMSVDPYKQALGYFFLTESPSEDYDRSGRLTERLEPERDTHPKAIYAVHKDGRWLAAQAGQA
ncbi:DUF6318 family protein [Sinomonas sp. ASV322]|uniref:DUF6318 family protein n=1 Tax=Sinomonas sp. ASV322 TaxID=3041920 RepID=UPI0027DBBA05|nr:DUF6318 family protein [Sinomonas sp. ASV322]MDQ4502735.1 DUF6318 family protein [Sinomonas sp. ASV322]